MELERDACARRGRHGGVPGHVPVARERPVVERQPGGRGIGVRLVEASGILLGEARGLAVAGVRLGRLQRLPVGGHLESPRLDRHQLLVDVVRAGVEQQLLDDHLGHRVLPFPEVVEADPPLAIGDVHGRPEVVVEGAPDPVVAVDRDRVLDAEGARMGDDVVDVMLEAELGRVDTDHRQPGVRVLRGPCTDIWRRSQPVDARVGPDVDEDDASAQSLRRQRLGVEPARRTVERRQLPFDRQCDLLACQAMGDGPDQAGSAASVVGHGRVSWGRPVSTSVDCSTTRETFPLSQPNG